MGKCKFQTEWLRKLDITGKVVESWGRKFNDEKIFCMICSKTFSIVAGFAKINQHTLSSTHKNAAKEKLNDNQLKLASTSATPTDDMCNQKHTLQLYSNRDAITKLELLWCMKIVTSNWSFNSCADLSEFIKNVHPEIPKGFSLSTSKIRYIITYALGPYFKRQLLTDIGSSFYTIHYDETTNSKSTKELQVGIRYFSTKLNKVVYSTLQTYFLGHATGEILSNFILKAVHDNGIPLSKLLMVSSDGPNVNKKVWRLLNEKVKEIRQKPLLDLGTCNIHIMHNAFMKGLEIHGMACSEFIISIYYFFNGWPSRKDDYEKIQIELGIETHSFLKHVPTRWLTIEPAIKKVLEQMPALKKYFQIYLPKHGAKTTLQGKYYKCITTFLKEDDCEALLHFVRFNAKIFLKFTSFFQRNEPLIHLMYDKLSEILVDVLGRVCKGNVILNFRNLDVKELFKESNLLEVKYVNPGNSTLELLNKLNERSRLQFLLNVRKSYIASASHIIQKIPLFPTKIRYLSFLNPVNILNTESEKHFVKSLSLLPYDVDDIDELVCEFKNLKCEEEVKIFQMNDKHTLNVEEFWYNIGGIQDSEGQMKYAKLINVVKQMLTFAHGSANIERSFSHSSNILSEERANMSLNTLNALINVQEVIRNIYYNKPELVMITKELLAMARTAHNAYNNYLEAERQKKVNDARKIEAEGEHNKRLEDTVKELEAKKKELEDAEKNLKSLQASKKEETEVVKTLLKDANKKLSTAIKAKEATSNVSVAKVLLETAIKSHEKEQEREKKIVELQRKILKRKKNTLDNFLIVANKRQATKAPDSD